MQRCPPPSFRLSKSVSRAEERRLFQIPINFSEFFSKSSISTLPTKDTRAAPRTEERRPGTLQKDAGPCKTENSLKSQEIREM